MIAVTAVALVVGAMVSAYYKALKPPSPKLCGSPNGPPITSPRVKLKDGRHLAYREDGVPKKKAKYKIIVVHGFGSSKEQRLSAPKDLVEELGIYFLHFDRAGYGESDPYPSRSVKSEAFDIEQLADKLNIDKFYVLGSSLGGYPIWSCLKYIPHRLLGAALVVPFVNLWWPCLPANIARESFEVLPKQYQHTYRVARYAPWLLYWWMTSKWFSHLRIQSQLNTLVFTQKDLEIEKKLQEVYFGQEKIEQQGAYDSVFRDLMVTYGKWEFDPLDIANPFPNNEGSVHFWQGYQDKIIPYKIGRFLSEKLPWMKYHEVADGGHMFFFEPPMCASMLKAFLLN
ncbi:uncharacterized protein LOC133790169 [Humulus lupulus]|uniref:uncharacterized protein LOC133790169 n=1 Tax=Humulus lupulus TaxID=3486 RepID=UPI002B40FAB3|nr:uncharacterized protein LOC133790169 [Humulus lupulus]